MRCSNRPLPDFHVDRLSGHPTSLVVGELKSVYLLFSTLNYQHAELAFPSLSLSCLEHCMRQFELPSCKLFLPDLRN